MSKTFTPFFTLVFLCSICFFSPSAFAQCSGGTSAGTVTPGINWQTATLNSGQYYVFSAVAGCSYQFSLCTTNGGIFTGDPTLTLRDDPTDSELSYNDDFCGVGSEITWQATSSGLFRIRLGELGNCNGGTNMTLAYRGAPPTGDQPCAASDLGSGCPIWATVTNCFAGSPNMARPMCGSFIGGDLWYTVLAPASGNLEIETSAGSITNAGMAVYTGTCTGLTEFACDLNSGTGNMPMLSLTGLTGGTTIYIRLWEDNGNSGGDFQFRAYETGQEFCMLGNAQPLAGGPSGCVQLTANTTSQRGCAWAGTMDFTQPFQHTIGAYLGTSDGGADGVTLVFQNDPRKGAACGTVSGGASLGLTGVTNCFVIEMDTYDNNSADPTRDLSQDHIAVFNQSDLSGVPLFGPVQASATQSNIEDGMIHILRVEWIPATMQMDIFFDGTRRLSFAYDIVNNALGGATSVIWGSSGSTGALANQQYFCNAAAILPTTLLGFEAHCFEDAPSLSWSFDPDQPPKTLTVERSNQEGVFTPVATFDYSPTINSWSDPSPKKNTSSYRLRYADEGGIMDISNRVEVTCEGKSHIVYDRNSRDIKIFLSHEARPPVRFWLYDAMGKLVYKNQWQEQGSEISASLPNLTKGLYIYRLVNGEYTDRGRVLVE